MPHILLQQTYSGDNINHMNTFKVNIKFKQGRTLAFSIDTEEDLKDKVVKEWATTKKDGALTMGDYVITIEDIQWIHIEGEPTGKREILEELSGKKI